jgi:hypothetical protein
MFIVLTSPYKIIVTKNRQTVTFLRSKYSYILARHKALISCSLAVISSLMIGTIYIKFALRISAIVGIRYRSRSRNQLMMMSLIVAEIEEPPFIVPLFSARYSLPTGCT